LEKEWLKLDRDHRNLGKHHLPCERDERKFAGEHWWFRSNYSGGEKDSRRFERDDRAVEINWGEG
jgi:hypothetical protein